MSLMLNRCLCNQSLLCLPDESIFTMPPQISVLTCCNSLTCCSLPNITNTYSLLNFTCRTIVIKKLLTIQLTEINLTLKFNN
jgi:hypothetical protein